MEQLIFFAIIIIFSIIDSVARTKKKRQAGGQGEAPQLPQEWEWEEDDLPTYDADPSYDDSHRPEPFKARQLPEYSRPQPSGGTRERQAQKSSEAMIPSDIWEEIAGLARGKLPEPKPAPPPPPVEIEPIPARPMGLHRVHRSHAGYGTDPSSRARSEQDGLDPLKTTLSQDASAVRRQLRSHSKSALRRAVILQELLGPPVSLQSERVAD